jgi:2-isopropylmalate synthase
MADKVLIFDTSLRDGEQSPGVAFNIHDKIEIANQLQRLGVDIIEAGFPASSPGDFEAVKAVAKELRESRIAGLARAVQRDVDLAWEALKDAAAPRIHVFVSTSDIHLMHQLAKDRDTVREMARTMVARAKGYTDDIEFSPMDATRSEWEYVYRMLEDVIDAGATTVNIPDTVGYTTPEEFSQFIHGILENVRNIHRATISVHCHNDLGLAVANSLSAVLAGARQVETCINGIGERAGNAALEEVVMGIKTRGDFYKVETNVKTRELYRTSRLVSDLTGMLVQPNKPVVGSNAFRHQSGIHQDGILKMRETYEIMDAKEIGWPSGSEIVLGKLSGRLGFKSRLDDLGIELTTEEFERAFDAFKELADKKPEIDDRDIEAIVGEERHAEEVQYKLDLLQVSSGNQLVPTATVRLETPDGKHMVHTATGTGPVDAAYQAINAMVGIENELTEFTVKSVTEGIDAQGEVVVRILCNGRTYTGRGADTDILVAAAKAMLQAINRALSVETPRQDALVRANP